MPGSPKKYVLMSPLKVDISATPQSFNLSPDEQYKNLLNEINDFLKNN